MDSELVTLWTNVVFRLGVILTLGFLWGRLLYVEIKLEGLKNELRNIHHRANEKAIDMPCRPIKE